MKTKTIFLLSIKIVHQKKRNVLHGDANVSCFCLFRVTVGSLLLIIIIGMVTSPLPPLAR